MPAPVPALSRRKERVAPLKQRQPATARGNRRPLPQTLVQQQTPPASYQELRQQVLRSQQETGMDPQAAERALRASGL